MSTYTEEEAKTKWCPFARVHQIDNVSSTSINRIADPSGKYDARGNVPACTPGASLCIGSACMAWKWRTQEFHRDTELWSKSKNRKVTSAWTDDSWWRPIGEDANKEPPPAIGYCSLAGGSR